MTTRLRVSVTLGKLGSGVHGKLYPAIVWDDQKTTVTGTVSGFFNLAWGLAERGHSVDAFCDTDAQPERIDGVNFYSVNDPRPIKTYDVRISILEPDILRAAPPSDLRVVVQWLNSFSYCEEGFDDYVDVYVSPSATHLNHLVRGGISRDKLVQVPLSINPALYEARKRRPFSIAYASSPDRGLHHLLNWWPEIKERVPEAELRVYYRVEPWLREILDEPSQRGSLMWKRAKTVFDFFMKSKDGDGVTLVGPTPTRKMMQTLCETRVLAYPCDPLRFTEGFSVTVLDACAAGCVPVISGADALMELWWNAAHVIPGKPAEKKDRWLDALVLALNDDDFASEVRVSAKARARELTRGRVAEVWERMLLEKLKEKRR
jgi:glycosyltransferase involved in cell wall biosynthesis